jgi:hypothetical protein
LSFLPGTSVSESNEELDDEENNFQNKKQFKARKIEDLDEKTKGYFTTKEMPSNWKSESEFYTSGKGSIRLDEAMKSNKYVPHSEYVNKLLLENKPKSFSYFKGELDPNFDHWVNMEAKKRSTNSYLDTNVKNEKEYYSSAAGEEINFDEFDEKYYPKGYKLYYCPFHDKVPFYGENDTHCCERDCKRKLDKLNSFIMLDLSEILTSIFSNAKLFDILMETNTKFNLIFKKLLAKIINNYDLKKDLKFVIFLLVY